MALRDRELKELKRAEMSGGKVNWGALDAKFIFAISPIVTAGVDVTIFAQISEAVIEALGKMGFSSELRGLVIFPIILEDEGGYSQEDFVKRRVSENTYFVGKNIPCTVWRKSKKKKRLLLAIENCLVSIRSIPEKYLSASSKEVLIDVISDVSNNL